MASAPTEAELWSAHVDALKAAIELRKPDAVQRLKFSIEKLDGEIIAWVLRSEIRLRAGQDTAVIDMRLKELEARMGDLAGVARLIRGTMLDHDNGPTPEQAGKARELISGEGECLGEFVNQDPGTDDLNSELKRAAADIQYGWAAITKGAACAVSGQAFGGLEIGRRAEELAVRYQQWVFEMHRKRRSTWAVVDVCCEGLSRSQSASKRRCDPVKVYGELVSGLTLYAEAFEPLSEVG